MDHYDYRFRSRHAGALWAGGYVAGIAGLLAYAVWSDQGPMTLLVFVAVVALPLAIAGILAEMRFTRLLQPVTLTPTGIESRAPDGIPLSLAWEEIERIEPFAWPDPDSRRMAKKSGVRLIAGDRRLRIYEHIRRYEDLRMHLARHLNC